MPFKDVYFGLPEDSNDPNYLKNLRIKESN